METFETKDIAVASYLKVNGHYCIGTIPANNKYKPNERLWMFEKNEQLEEDLKNLDGNDPLVPVKQVFMCSSILKNLLNDKDYVESNEQ